MSFLSGEEFYKVADIEWWIPGILPKGQVCGIWGDSDAGKSFVVTDWFGCILTRTPWQGRPVEQGSALLIATENPTDFRRRFKGWEQAHATRWDGLPWAVEPEGVQLLSESSVAGTVAQVKALHFPPGVIFIDTLGKAMVQGVGAGDPDKSRHDMNLAIDNANRVRSALGPDATVVLVHHSNRNSKSMAGSAAFRQGVYMLASMTGTAGDGATSMLRCDRLKVTHFPDIALRFREVQPADTLLALVIEPGDLGANTPGAATPGAATGATRKRQPRETTRTAFERMVAEGWENAAIAEALGKTPGAVRKRRERMRHLGDPMRHGATFPPNVVAIAH